MEAKNNDDTRDKLLLTKTPYYSVEFFRTT